jgi:hypothetical protein
MNQARHAFEATFSSARRALRISALCVLSAAALIEETAYAHDPAGMTARDVALEQAVADAQRQRDEIVLSSASTPQLKDEAASVVASMFAWSAKNDILTVCFWPNPDQKAAVTDTAEEKEIVSVASKWTTNAAITFQFYNGTELNACKDHASADIRVTLHPLDRKYYSPVDPTGDFDWSRYGKQSVTNSAAVSLSLVLAHQAYLLADTAYFHFNVAHEFGHALGLLHEHQRIDCSKWLADDATVTKAYQFKTVADLDLFKENLLKIPATNAYYKPVTKSPFDLNSIMMYNFPPEIWKQVPNNPCLRTTAVEYPDADDLSGIIAIYGPRKTAQVSSAQPAGSPTLAPPAALPQPTTTPSSGAANQEPLTRIDAQKQALNAQIQQTQQAASQLAASGTAQVRGGVLNGSVLKGGVVKGGTQKRICLNMGPIGGNNCIVFSTNDGGAGASQVQSQAANQVRELQANIDRLSRMRDAVARAIDLSSR